MPTASVRAIAAAHHRSFSTSARSGPRVAVRLYGAALLTVLVLAVTWLVRPGGLNLDGSIGEPIAAALSLLAGLLFALGVTVLEKAIEMDQAAPSPGRGTSADAKRLQALSANAIFTSLLAGAGTGVLIAASLVPPLAAGLNILATGLVVAVGTSGVAVSSRVFAETADRTDRARTGVSRDRRRDAEPGSHDDGAASEL